MAEIVNLRQARKQRARREAEDAASANRAKHGRTRAEREAEARREAERRRLLDGARLGKPEG
ncbi:MAG TPA: DUF4169 family protein [Acetobacteraceae bacterium]|jgi:hypothetical protein|nr:DUF4169 family protein [Acetobacteraceae bacterium]